jgi:hypothetical protein
LIGVPRFPEKLLDGILNFLIDEIGLIEVKLPLAVQPIRNVAGFPDDDCRGGRNRRFNGLAVPGKPPDFGGNSDLLKLYMIIKSWNTY